MSSGCAGHDSSNAKPQATSRPRVGLGSARRQVLFARQSCGLAPAPGGRPVYSPVPSQAHSASAERRVSPSEPLRPSGGRGRPATRSLRRSFSPLYTPLLQTGHSYGVCVTPAARFYKQGAPPELARVLDEVAGVGGGDEQCVGLTLSQKSEPSQSSRSAKEPP